ncbi:hypothetical protein KP509_07G018600 [Ceratopteris richardii]|nr:hypothetical protein KP509_07G018600 [Ceratopteris richardii]
MPLSVAEYRIAQMYMVTKMQQENTSSSEGVEVLVNRPFKDDVLGEGQYTMKVYNLQSKFPSWITAIAPADCLQIEEEAWNAYPKCKTVLKCTYFTRFKLTIETLHVPDNGKSDNVHNLDAESLALRKVEVLDIASTARDYWNYMLAEDSSIDLSTFKPAKVERGPLLPGWQGIHDPVMTAYKLVTVDAPYWGFGYRMEQAILAAERALFLESHRRCFFWIDDWYGLSEEDVRRLEAESDAMLNKIRHGGSEGEREDETTRSLE